MASPRQVMRLPETPQVYQLRWYWFDPRPCGKWWAMRVALLKAGITSSHRTLGDYERWFEAACSATWLPIELHAFEPLPSLRGFDAVVMSGSPLSVTALETEPNFEHRRWMLEAADAMLEAAQQRPVLGVCFGHQLAGFRLGARVRKNPLGRELGTVDVTLTEQGLNDPLFDGLGARLRVQATHEDEVEFVPPGATLLATNAHSAVQAFGFARLRCVQFHPEMTAQSIRYCIDSDAARSPEERARLVSDDSADGARLIRNFLALV